MKKPFVLASVLGVLLAPTAPAQMQIVLHQDTADYSYGVGGEFRATGSVVSANPTLAGYSPLTGDPTAQDPYFQTFCIEANEHFSPGSTYDVTLSDRAMYGSQPPGGDPVSIGTAWIYSQFAAGTLRSWNGSNGCGREGRRSGRLRSTCAATWASGWSACTSRRRGGGGSEGRLKAKG